MNGRSVSTSGDAVGDTIRAALEVLVGSVIIGPANVVEMRIPRAGRLKTVSGYYNDFDALAGDAAHYDGEAPGIYFTLNPCNPALLARAANRAKPYAENATSDTDIVRRVWLFVDLDPKRPAGIASTDEEHDIAIGRAHLVRAKLRELGWPDPVLVDSGNGAYLLYRIDLPNDAHSLALVSGVLEGIASEYSDDVAVIDTTVSNAARIARIPGTMNCKGDDTPERPHRRATILEAPAELLPVPIELLRQVAAWAPKPEEAPKHRSGNGVGIDLDDFIREHGIAVQLDTREWRPGCRRVRLAVCPFNSAHTGGSAALFQFSSGAVAFRCLHNGCHDRGWRELREHVESPAPARVVHDLDEPEVDLGSLLADLESLLKRFVVFARTAQLVAVMLWIVHTHVFDQFEATPYIAVTSPEKRSGKTRLLDVLELLVARAWRAILPSEAVVYRKISAHAPTLLLDEVDAIYGPKAREHEGLRALLNGGHRRGSRVPRCVGKNFALEEFDTYCPKAIAGIGKLPDTVADRSIPIRLARRKKSENVERFRARAALTLALPVREQLERWAKRANLRERHPEIPNKLDDRAADGWEPLLAIADLAGGDWPRRARAAAIELHAEADPEADSLGVRLLADTKLVFGSEKTMFTAHLLAELHRLDAAPWSDLPSRSTSKPLDSATLARLLKPYGIRSKSIRIGEDTGKGYERVAFVDAWDRYLEAQSDPSRRHNGAESSTCSDPGPSPERAENDHPSHGETPQIQHVAAKCDAVTAEIPEAAVGPPTWGADL